MNLSMAVWGDGARVVRDDRAGSALPSQEDTRRGGESRSRALQNATGRHRGGSGLARHLAPPRSGAIVYGQPVQIRPMLTDLGVRPGLVPGGAAGTASCSWRSPWVQFPRQFGSLALFHPDERRASFSYEAACLLPVQDPSSRRAGVLTTEASDRVSAAGRTPVRHLFGARGSWPADLRLSPGASPAAGGIRELRRAAVLASPCHDEASHPKAFSRASRRRVSFFTPHVTIPRRWRVERVTASGLQTKLQGTLSA